MNETTLNQMSIEELAKVSEIIANAGSENEGPAEYLGIDDTDYSEIQEDYSKIFNFASEKFGAGPWSVALIKAQKGLL